MPRKDPAFIKRIVRGNFERSASIYDAFEEHWGLFSFLTHHLAGVCDIGEGMKVMDVGCGTGASTLILGELAGPEGRVTGVDFSQEMLRTAEAGSNGAENVEYRLCDADALMEAAGHRSCNSKAQPKADEHHLCNTDAQPEIDRIKFDAVLYNATIFLIPEPVNTLRCACDVLVHGGMCGMNYLAGVFDSMGENDGTDLFESSRTEGVESAPYGRGIVDTGQLPELMSSAGFEDVRQGTVSRKMNRAEIEEFYGIPAQSAGLYPRTAYHERLEKLRDLFDHFESTGIAEFYQKWGWVTGAKERF